MLVWGFRSSQASLQVESLCINLQGIKKLGQWHGTFLVAFLKYNFVPYSSLVTSVQFRGTRLAPLVVCATLDCWGYEFEPTLGVEIM